jgi:hypothetical protein
MTTDEQIEQKISALVETTGPDLTAMFSLSPERHALMKRISSDCQMVSRKISENLLALQDEEDDLTLAGVMAYSKEMAEQQASLFEALAAYFASRDSLPPQMAKHRLNAQYALDEIERLIDI